MPIIATAGHVDHGKSTLVRALTGRDPDRWQEEKDRGLTIDLGFAWADLGTGAPVGFVDVPGHERFIKNMLAGVGAVDVALFVVAADEGWMPQSEEHASVLDVLGVTHGVIALTRTDLVDEETLQLAHLDILEHIEGTLLEQWPLVPVSAVTGAGVAGLEAALADALAAAGTPRDVGRPRLWVDRSFLISGAGLVVTGTLVDGTLHQGDELDLWPGPRRVRVRGLQRHETSAEKASPGARTAVNLAGVDRLEVERGALLCSVGQLRGSRRMLVDVTTVRSLAEPLTNRGAYQVHLGSGAWPVRLRLLDAAELVGSGAALLQLDHVLPAAMGDRFVLRETGRRAVVAGGVVLDPEPPHSGPSLSEAAEILRPALASPPDGRATALLEVRKVAALAALAADSGGGKPTTEITTESDAVAASAVEELNAAITKSVAAFHQANPLRPGIPRAELSTRVGIDPELLGALLADAPNLVDEGATVRTAGFGGGAIAPEEWADARSALLSAGMAAPRTGSLGLDTEVLHALVRNGELIRISGDLVYLPEHIAQIRSSLDGLPDEFTVADFRDALGISRRQAVPLLEWLDAQGVTRRRGDVRTVR